MQRDTNRRISSAVKKTRRQNLVDLLLGSVRSRHKASKRKQRRMFAETLEQRQLLAAHGDDFSSASSVSLVPDLVSTVQGYVGDGDYYDADVDLFELSLDTGDEFTADINSNGSGLDSYLRLFDSDGYEIASNNDGDISDPDSLLSYSITSSGTYYLGVSSVGNEYYEPDYSGYADDGSTTGAYDLDLLTSQGGSQTNTTFSDFGDDISYASSVSLVSDVVSTIQGYVWATATTTTRT